MTNEFTIFVRIHFFRPIFEFGFDFGEPGRS